MSRRIRPSARKKTLFNVMNSRLSETDKKCIEEVFEKFSQRVDVVRCRDCKYSEELQHKKCLWCSKHLTSFLETDFCSYGERKDAE